MDTITITETGCFLSNARGHYISRDVIDFAVEHGWIIGPFEQYAVSMYDSANEGHSAADYPQEALMELADEAVEWLNSGRIDCDKCGGTGQSNPALDPEAWRDVNGDWRCKKCSGTGRGDRIEGQNFPPKVPEGFTWAFEEGDFGLWKYDEGGNFLFDEN
jgi:hypothetical protein